MIVNLTQVAHLFLFIASPIGDKMLIVMAWVQMLALAEHTGQRMNHLVFISVEMASAGIPQASASLIM